MTRGVTRLGAAALGLLAPLAVHAGTVWLAVVDRDTSAAALLARAPLRVDPAPSELIVASRDCGERRNTYLRVIGVLPSRPAAVQALRDFKVERGVDQVGHAPAPAVRACTVRPGSLLARRVSVLDPTLVGLPADALNWEEADRLTALHPLANDRALLLTRFRSTAANDPLQGRRVRVSLVGAQDAPVVLREQCPEAGRVAERHGNIAFQCAGEQAGSQLLHTVHVFDRDGRPLAEVARCRNPRWLARDAVRCDAERVDSSGALHLTPRRIPVAIAAPLR